MQYEVIKKTPKEWVQTFGLTNLDDLTKGFVDFDSFYRVPITQEEFQSRISKCKTESYPKQKDKDNEEPKNYSVYRTTFSVDPDLEQIAHDEVNKMGNDFLLEGATKLTGGWFRLWYKRFKGCLSQVDLPLDETKRRTKRVSPEVKNVPMRVHINFIKPKVSENDKYFIFIKKDYTKWLK